MIHDDVKKMYTFVGQYPTAVDKPALVEKAQQLMLNIREQVSQRGTALNDDEKRLFTVAVGHYKQLCSIANIDVDKNLTEIRLWQRAQGGKRQETPTTQKIEPSRPKS